MQKKDYVKHHHDASGIMTLLHDPDYNPPDSKVVKEDKTTDVEMKLPESWFGQDHVDPRPACDDNQLRESCFHTVRCGRDERLHTPTGEGHEIPISYY
mmetsp:Transcript_17131/g.32514  ORF Transcript_17131/g.32514 Transcript_17131/m.32514 type:complete len:98 (+) Transcript_17131:530-823(+)